MKFFIFSLILSTLIYASSVKNKGSYDYLEYSNSLSQDFYSYEMQELLKMKYIPLDSNLNSDYIANDININEKLSKEQKNILEDTAYIQLAMVTAIGVLLIMPESVTNWDKDELVDEPLTTKWKDNVSAGPIIDEDEFAINYLGHPISGAVYYAMARNDGLNPFESFIFSTLMSSFFWEYGYEAFAEIPSMQDLVSTPIVGAFMGEYMHYLEGVLDENGGVIWNSRSLGGLSYFFLDPMGNAANGVSGFLNLDVTMKFNTYQEFSYKKQTAYNIALNKPSQFSSYNYGVELNIKF